MKDIPNFDTFMKVEPIHKGWSGDKKYLIYEATNAPHLLFLHNTSYHPTTLYE